MSDILAGGGILASNISSATEAAALPPAPPACALCNDAGFVRLRRDPGHPEFGRAVPCDCATRESEEKRQERLQRYSNLGPLTRIRFETLEGEDSPAFRRAFAAAMGFARGEQPRTRWLLLWGESGSGKTSLGAAMANDRIQRGAAALYVVVPDLLDRLRAAYQADAVVPYPQLFEQVRSAPFLILDDVHASNLTPWADEKLFQLLNHRENGGLPTAVLSGKAPAALPGTSGGFLARLADARQVCLLPSAAAPDETERYQQIGGMTVERLERYSFERFRVEGNHLTQEEAGNLELLRNVARDWSRAPQGWMTFVGPTGTGKSHLAAAVAIERLGGGDSVFFVVVPDLLDHLRRAYSPDNDQTYDEVFATVREAELLILDDLGAHATTPWAREKLYQLFSHRYLQSLPTVITTNENPEDLDPRLTSRMLHHQVYRFIAPDHRTGLSSRSGQGRAGQDRPANRRRPSAWDKPRW